MLLDDDDDSDGQPAYRSASDGQPAYRECSNSGSIAGSSNTAVSDSTGPIEDLTVTPMMVEVNTSSDIVEDPLHISSVQNCKEDEPQ
jgi:hypothetical protein